MIKIVDNLLSPTYANTLENDVSKILQYAYCRETSVQNQYYDGPIYRDNNTFDYGQLTCPIIVEQHNNFAFSWYFDLLKSLIYTVQDRVPELHIKGVVRLKANLLLQQKDAPEGHYNIPHQDASHNCYSMVYYCNDSDGDTYLFNEHYEDDKTPNQLSIAQRVSPKKNRAVIFESNRYHASSNPIHNRERFIFNFVFEAHKNNGEIYGTMD
jgi:hypothetical protein